MRSPARCCAAARLACKNAMVGTGWGNSHSGYIKRLRKHNSHFVGSSFLARKAACVLSRGLLTKNADCHMLVNK